MVKIFSNINVMAIEKYKNHKRRNSYVNQDFTERIDTHINVLHFKLSNNYSEFNPNGTV